MPKVSVPLQTWTSNGPCIFAFIVRLTDLVGTPLDGEELRVNLEGDGSLDGEKAVKSKTSFTDDDGVVTVQWYATQTPVGNELRGTLSASHSDPFCEILISEPVKRYLDWYTNS